MSNYAKIKTHDIANGKGIRVSIFFSGCNFHCKNCFNSELWDFDYGIPFTENTIFEILNYLSPTYIKGLSILGGEPFQNQKAVLDLCKSVKSTYTNKDIWIWTGNKFKNIKENEILNYVDVVIDGKYEDKHRDLTLNFRGSSNQNVWQKDKNGIWNINKSI